MFDIGFTRENCWFRLRAAAIIIENGYVLFAKNENVDYYYSIGGGVHHNETTEDAVIREVFEETGVHYEIDRLAFIHENFCVGKQDDFLKGKKMHEVAFYYLMKPRGTQELGSVNSYSLDGAVEKAYWLPIKELSKYKAFPHFFTEKLFHISNEVEHIVTIE